MWIEDRKADAAVVADQTRHILAIMEGRVVCNIVILVAAVFVILLLVGVAVLVGAGLATGWSATSVAVR